LFTRKKRAYPWWGQNTFHQVIKGWDEEKKIMNCIVLYRRWSNMLYLQVVDPTSNKENFPHTLDPQKKRSTPQLN